MTADLPSFESEFSFRTRQRDIETIGESDFEFFVIGGGINGSGTASLLAQNGRKVLLVDRNDFASGTSSGSSKLIHGGLRYLANFEFREVKRLLSERNYLLTHTEIVKPLLFDVVVDEYSWKKISLRTGLTIYNLLSGRIKLPRYHRNSGTFPEHVKGYFTYEDSMTDDSLLVISNVVTAHSHGAICLNYVEPLEIWEENGKWHAILKDFISGRTLQISTKFIVNAAGPWVTRIPGIDKAGNLSNLLLSKGIHIVVDSSLFHGKNAVVFRSPIDRRQMFIIPRGEVIHIGTTDTFTSSPDDWKITEEDIEYIISSARSIIPELGRKDIIESFAGIRPLFGSGSDPGKVTRKSSVIMNKNVVSILGGKITDYRLTAQSVARIINKCLPRNKRLTFKGLPTIDYRRNNSDAIIQAVFNECALNEEDILRRRIGARLYTKDGGKSLESHVKEKVKGLLLANKN